jgi:hypothetical protein
LPFGEVRASHCDPLNRQTRRQHAHGQYRRDLPPSLSEEYSRI